MSDQSPLSSKVGLDTTDFKAGIAAMNREMRVLESAFRASTAQLGNWADTASGLEQRVDSLNAQIDLQKQKVAATRAEYERVRAEKGENSRAAQDLEIRLNKETETLGKMQNELGETEGKLQDMQGGSEEAGDAVEEMGDQTEDAGKQADDSGSKFEGFKGVVDGLKSVARAAVTALAGLLASVVGLGGAIAGLVVSTARTSDELVALSDKTGIGVERLQELAYVADQVGVSQETITGSLGRLTRSMATATDQTADYAKKAAEAKAEGKEFDGELGDAAAAFQQLGVSVTDSNGNLRDSEAVFNDVITALGSVPNEAERDALAMQLFGKSALELNPLIKAGADEIANLSAEARDVGAVMSEDTVQGMAAFSDSLDSLKAGLQGTLGTLAAAFLPGFQGVATKAEGYLTTFANIVKNSGGDIGRMAGGVKILLGTILGDLARNAPGMLQAGLTMVQSILDAIVSALPMLMPAAISILTSLVTFLIGNLPMLIQTGLTLLLTLMQGMLAALPQIIPVIMQIIPQITQTLIAMLPELIVTGIQLLVALILGLAQALPQLIPAVAEIIPVVVTTLIENLPLLIDAALQLIIALATGLVTALPTLIEAIPQIMQAIFDALIVALPLIGEAALQLLTTLATGIVDNLPLIGETAGQIIGTLVTGIGELAQDIMDVGGSIVDGIWQGISDNIGAFTEQVKGLFSGIVDGVKESLGIRSPSRVFAGIGANMAAGLGVGFGERIGRVQGEIERAMAGLSSSPTITPNIAANGVAEGAGEKVIRIELVIQGGTGVERQQATLGFLEAARQVGLVGA